MTQSDADIISLIMENEDLAVLQSMDVFNWYENKGETEHIISKRGNKKLSYLEKTLDLFLVDKEKLKETPASFRLYANLSADGLSERDAVPDLGAIGLYIHEGGTKRSFGGYLLVKSERYMEYPDPKSGMENTNKTIRARLYNKKEGKGTTLVYRQTLNRNEVIGSRMYIAEKGGLKPLEKGENFRVIGFMNAIDYWHDNELTEKESRLEKFGSGLNIPSYMSMYS